ncbi:MAG TPA: hypothetical protein VJV79_12630 [Polyangiaceae bacterium]|nr:hypothetical protein [Polyangiaceae bacterium]
MSRRKTRPPVPNPSAQSGLPLRRVHGAADAESSAAGATTAITDSANDSEKIVEVNVVDSPETNVHVDVDRDKTIDIFKQAMDVFDRTMVTVSGGALAVSISFLHDIAPNPSRLSLIPLVLGWGGLLVSLGTIIISMPVGQKSIKVRLRGEDDAKLAELTTKLNHASVYGLLIGIASLAVFAAVNMYAEKPKPAVPQPVLVQCVSPLSATATTSAAVSTAVPPPPGAPRKPAAAPSVP